MSGLCYAIRRVFKSWCKEETAYYSLSSYHPQTAATNTDVVQSLLRKLLEVKLRLLKNPLVGRLWNLLVVINHTFETREQKNIARQYSERLLVFKRVRGDLVLKGTMKCDISCTRLWCMCLICWTGSSSGKDNVLTRIAYRKDVLLHPSCFWNM